MRRISPRCGGKLALGVFQNFILMTRHSLGEAMEGVTEYCGHWPNDPSP
jgi:hypothetical protein